MTTIWIVEYGNVDFPEETLSSVHSTKEKAIAAAKEAAIAVYKDSGDEDEEMDLQIVDHPISQFVRLELGENDWWIVREVPVN